MAEKKHLKKDAIIIITCHPVVKETLKISNPLLPDPPTDFEKIDKLVVHLQTQVLEILTF